MSINRSTAHISNVVQATAITTGAIAVTLFATLASADTTLSPDVTFFDGNLGRVTVFNADLKPLIGARVFVTDLTGVQTASEDLPVVPSGQGGAVQFSVGTPGGVVTLSVPKGFDACNLLPDLALLKASSNEPTFIAHEDRYSVWRILARGPCPNPSDEYAPRTTGPLALAPSTSLLVTTVEFALAQHH